MTYMAPRMLAHGDPFKPRLNFVRTGPAAGMWRCCSLYGPACFSTTPRKAYELWLRWQVRGQYDRVDVML